MLAQIVTEIHAPDLAVEGASAGVVAGGNGDHSADMLVVHHHGDSDGGGGVVGGWKARFFVPDCGGA